MTSLPDALEGASKKLEIFPWHYNLLTRLSDLKNQNRIPHAILIDSKTHSDAESFTTYLSTLLLCDNNNGYQICGQCKSCRGMQSGSYSNFKLITILYDEKKKKINKNINIEQIRKVIYDINLSPNYDNYNVVAIYPAEKMGREAANSLLKTLEEPGKQAVIILHTSNKGLLPVTIRSRCQIWNLKCPDNESGLDWLKQQGLSETDAIHYLQLSMGDPLLAKKMAEDNYSEIVESFKISFSAFLKGRSEVTALVNELTKYQPDVIRRLIDRVVTAYCYRFCGLDSEGNDQATTNRSKAMAMFELYSIVFKRLAVEDNNLDLHLQLEDVLISIKQILRTQD
ncbi:MAG: DNA polymerase III delta' subunit [Gammaproteobacteria bacterium]|jgi:DNA polymerase III delta' subunit